MSTVPSARHRVRQGCPHAILLSAGVPGFECDTSSGLKGAPAGNRGSIGINIWLPIPPTIAPGKKNSGVCFKKDAY